MFVSVFEWYYAREEVGEMVTRSNLDALTPGMRAKLDPLSRIAREPGVTRRFSIVRNESEVTLPEYFRKLRNRTAIPAAKK